MLPDDPLNLPKLRTVDVHLDYRAEHIQGRSMPIDSLVLHMDIVNGAIALHPLSFGVGRGRITSDVALTPGDRQLVQARTEVRFERVDFAHLMRATGRYQGAGLLSGTARVQGTGRSIAEILGRGDGALTLSMADGDLSKLLADLVGLRLGSALISSLGGPSRTRVACFVADLVLHRGVLATRALLLETADAVTEGRGALDLGRQRVEVRLHTKSKHLTIGVLPAPLLISGPLIDPARVILHEPRLQSLDCLDSDAISTQDDPGRINKSPSVAPSAGTSGGIVGVLAELPTIQLGTGDDPRCGHLIGRTRHNKPTSDLEAKAGIE